MAKRECCASRGGSPSPDRRSPARLDALEARRGGSISGGSARRHDRRLADPARPRPASAPKREPRGGAAVEQVARATSDQEGPEWVAVQSGCRDRRENEPWFRHQGLLAFRRLMIAIGQLAREPRRFSSTHVQRFETVGVASSARRADELPFFMASLSPSRARPARKFGAEIYRSTCRPITTRELGVLMTAIMVAGARAAPSPRNWAR